MEDEGQGSMHPRGGPEGSVVAAGLAWLEDALWDAVDRHLDGNARGPTLAVTRRHAELAYLRIVHGCRLEDLAARLEEVPSQDTLSQWIRRGHAKVLEPALLGWLDEMSPKEKGAITGIYARTLIRMLRDAEPTDARSISTP